MSAAPTSRDQTRRLRARRACSAASGKPVEWSAKPTRSRFTGSSTSEQLLMPLATPRSGHPERMKTRAHRPTMVPGTLTPPGFLAPSPRARFRGSHSWRPAPPGDDESGGETGVSDIGSFGFRICFGFRVSCFGFVDSGSNHSCRWAGMRLHRFRVRHLRTGTAGTAAAEYPADGPPGRSDTVTRRGAKQLQG